VADCLAHPLHLVLAALVEPELEEGAVAPAAQEACAGGRRRPVFEPDALSERTEGLLGRRALHHCLVDLLHLVAGVHKPVRKRAVVGQEEGAGRVSVEASDRDDAALVAHDSHDRRPTVGVAGGRDDACRLVQKDVDERLRAEGAPVELHAVVGLHERREARHLSVHAHAAGADELVRAAPGRDTGPRQVGVQAHGSDCDAIGRAVASCDLNKRRVIERRLTLVDGADSTLAITGGTDKYRNAHGSIDLHARSATEFDFVFHVIG
jgi:hypothetical protein